MKTYKVTDNEKEQFIEETTTRTDKRIYHKQWLIDEIARLQVLLDEINKK